jgi:tryptophan synthase alpha chain
VNNPLDQAFAQSRSLLVTYLTAGDPTPQHSLQMFQALLRGGADVLEIGVPFSDPGADGPAIQRASERALLAGSGLETALAIAAALPADVPKILFGYLNPFLAFGYDRLAERCAAAGVHGLLCVDCPPEEEPEFRVALRARGLHPILLVAPTTPDDRIVALAAEGSGFLYYVSMTGVTGAELTHQDAVAARVARVRELGGLPVAVGFGVATAQDVARLAPTADGVVVGSALVRILEEHGVEAAAPLEALTRALKLGFGP